MPKPHFAAQSIYSQEENENVGKNSPISNPSVFWFRVYEGIFEHAPTLSDAVWLFMWCIARTTDEDGGDGTGKVLGGIPIPDDRPAGELGFPVKTIRRWRRMLTDGGYVNVLRTPYGFRYTLLKSKRWQKPTPRELPKRAISHLESARNGNSDLPLRKVRMPETGRESARNGKYKEDYTETRQRRDSGQDSARSLFFLEGEGNPPLKTPPKPRRVKPSGRGKHQLGHAQSEAEIAKVMECQDGTISHYLADRARSTYYLTSEQAQKRCGEEVEHYRRAFEVIEYPFDLSSTVLGYEFCWNVWKVVEESKNETPRPKNWELCERILDECARTWEGVETYSGVGPPYWPTDFNDHINRLFERQK